MLYNIYVTYGLMIFLKGSGLYYAIKEREKVHNRVHEALSKKSVIVKDMPSYQRLKIDMRHVLSYYLTTKVNVYAIWSPTG